MIESNLNEVLKEQWNKRYRKEYRDRENKQGKPNNPQSIRNTIQNSI